MRTSENSSDLERAAAARSIAVEFLEVRMAVQKLQRCEYQYFSRSRCTFWDPDSTSQHSPRCRTQSRQVPKLHLRRRLLDDATRARQSPQQRAGAAPAPANLDGIYTFQLHRARHFPEMPISSQICLNARHLHRRPGARTPTAVCLIHARYPSPRCPARTRARQL